MRWAVRDERMRKERIVGMRMTGRFEILGSEESVPESEQTYFEDVAWNIWGEMKMSGDVDEFA